MNPWWLKYSTSPAAFVERDKTHRRCAVIKWATSDLPFWHAFFGHSLVTCCHLIIQSPLFVVRAPNGNKALEGRFALCLFSIKMHDTVCYLHMLCVKFNQVNAPRLGLLEKSPELSRAKGHFSADFYFHEIKSETCNHKAGLCHPPVGASSHAKN